MSSDVDMLRDIRIHESLMTVMTAFKQVVPQDLSTTERSFHCRSYENAEAERKHHTANQRQLLLQGSTPGGGAYVARSDAYNHC